MEPTMSRLFLAAAAALLAILPRAEALEAQGGAQAAASTFLAVGTKAPDVSFTGATRWGVLGQEVKLSDFAGKTVVLAFFPAARTRGCTIQMQTYRDEYQRVFSGGRNVVLIAISKDPADALRSWAYDEDFPFLFGSDPDGDVYRAFGGTPGGNGSFGRTLVVIDPAGNIAELLPRFLEVDPTSYDQLQATVARVAAR
jgi:peroxiredoxin Q/BCP